MPEIIPPFEIEFITQSELDLFDEGIDLGDITGLNIIGNKVEATIQTVEDKPRGVIVAKQANEIGSGAAEPTYFISEGEFEMVPSTSGMSPMFEHTVIQNNNLILESPSTILVSGTSNSPHAGGMYFEMVLDGSLSSASGDRPFFLTTNFFRIVGGVYQGLSNFSYAMGMQSNALGGNMRSVGRVMRLFNIGEKIEVRAGIFRTSFGQPTTKPGVQNGTFKLSIIQFGYIP